MKGIQFQRPGEKYALSGQFSASKEMLESVTQDLTLVKDDYDELKKNQQNRSSYDKQSDYHKRRLDRS